jgi:hypothetical protein
VLKTGFEGVSGFARSAVCGWGTIEVADEILAGSGEMQRSFA